MDCKQYRCRNKLITMQVYKQIQGIFRKGNFAIFPVVISEKSANHPDFGKIKVVSGVRLPDSKWHYQDHYYNMRTWDEVFSFYLQEIDLLERLVNAVTDDEREIIYKGINRSGTEVKGIDEMDFMQVSEDDGLTSKLKFCQLDEDSPRWKKEHWTPILSAWEFSLSKLLELKKENQLVEL